MKRGRVGGAHHVEPAGSSVPTPLPVDPIQEEIREAVGDSEMPYPRSLSAMFDELSETILREQLAFTTQGLW